MNRIAQLSAAERRELFTQAGADLGLPPFFVEKDFWVCWTLQCLFGDPEIGPHLTFRGGTSLSKAWGCIERFSEDIDIAMNRDWAGMEAEKDPMQPGISGGVIDNRLRQLRKHCRTTLTETVQPLLSGYLERVLGIRERWNLAGGDLTNEQDPFTLYLHYPQAGLQLAGGYSLARVKIELSARAEPEPMEKRIIRPYVMEALPGVFGTGDFEIACVKPERTFWEKTTLVHEQNIRPSTPEKPAVPRTHLARHLYDLHRLWTNHGLSGHSDLTDLFPEVIAHRKVFFRSEWVDYETLTVAALRLVPPDLHLADWRADYQQMRPMFFNEPPEFDEVIQTLLSIQTVLAGSGPEAPEI